MKSKRRVLLIIGIVILTFFIVMALFPRAFTSYDRKASFGAWLPMSFSHILGTNSLGYDIFTELVYGAGETLLVGLSSSLLSLVIGVTVGFLASCKGAVGAVFNGLINVFVMLPRLIILIVLSAFFGSSPLSLIILISVFGWVGTARTVRAKTTHLKSTPFIEACAMYGYSKTHTAVKHVLPNLYDVLISRFLLGVNGCILMESTLSFLGIGNLYSPTWGVMISFARLRGAISMGAFQYILAPCVCIMLLSLAFYFISLYVDGKQSTITDC